jgi:hypothetical protein
MGVERIHFYARDGPEGRRQFLTLRAAADDSRQAFPLFSNTEKAESFLAAADAGEGWWLLNTTAPEKLLAFLRTVRGLGVPLMVLDPHAAAGDMLAAQCCDSFAFLIEAEGDEPLRPRRKK